MSNLSFPNPFRPGAGHRPPHLAGRELELAEFERLLQQDQVLENMVLTGLRGVGKTVLLEEFKPRAVQRGWLWAGNDLSESASLTEERITTRLIADLATLTSTIVVGSEPVRAIGFEAPQGSSDTMLTYEVMQHVYAHTPGMSSDKLKAVLELAWLSLNASNRPLRGVIFAYDEAQNLADQGPKEFPLSLLLDVFQSIQRKGVRFLLVLSGLPTLFPKLVEARTFSERMFRVVTLKKLSDEASREAILRPIADAACPVHLHPKSVEGIIRTSAGYPYFIQFICREVYDAILATMQVGNQEEFSIPAAAIISKLDADFFAGRWAKATDRQREILWVISKLEGCDDEFTVQEVVEASRKMLRKPFGSSHANQMLAALTAAGLVYKNRYGKYSFAVPLFGQFVSRTMEAQA
jgi:hypothetical protein